MRPWFLWPLLGPALTAQAPAPNPHWGACVYPRARQELRGTFSFNRFTEFDGDGVRYNEIQESTGFNMASLQYTHELLNAAGGRVTVSFDAGAGVSHDQPTEYLQNDYIHYFRHLPEVPTDDQRTSGEYLAGLAATRWFGSDEVRRAGDGQRRDHGLRWTTFVGAGMVASTIYHEAYGHVGGALFLPDWHVRLQLVDRVGLVTESNAYGELAPFTNVAQAGILYAPRNYYLGPGLGLGRLLRWDNLLPWRWPHAIHEFAGRPEVGLHVSYDTGLFVDPADHPIDTWYVSVSAEWPTGLRVETWNDMLSGTDHGPSFGVLMAFDLTHIIDLLER